jgi:hypothetical protein
MALERGGGCSECKVQNEKNSSTYQSAPVSARAEPALLPAAAEANEVGAMVVLFSVKWLWGG